MYITAAGFAPVTLLSSSNPYMLALPCFLIHTLDDEWRSVYLYHSKLSRFGSVPNLLETPLEENPLHGMAAKASGKFS